MFNRHRRLAAVLLVPSTLLLAKAAAAAGAATQAPVTTAPAQTTQRWEDPAARTFHSFSPTHFVALAAFVAATALAVYFGRRWRGTRRGRALDVLLGLYAAATWIWATVWWLLPRNFKASESWPVHVCDLMGPVAALALLTNARSARALLYFGGIGLSTQALITPTVDHGPGHVLFWLFWLVHAAIVGGAIYDLAARGFRPGWRDYATAASGGALYLAVILPLDVYYGFNYGYVGNLTPKHPTIIDALGPWPWRVVIIAAIVAVAWALMVLPWELSRRRRERR